MKNLLPFDDWMVRNLADDAEGAAALLRRTLAEDQADPQILLTLVQRIVRARGGIEDLGLSLEEKAELATALSHSVAAATLMQTACAPLSGDAAFWLGVSQTALDKIWDNKDDDVYAELLN